MIKIVNPIYDVAFKFLLEDKEIAILFLSQLIKEQIVDLEFRPKEHISEVLLSNGQKRNFKLYRLDFKAKIKTAEGKLKIVLIEIQKSFLKTDLFRFRKYLGEQYFSIENYVNPQDPIEPIPIFTIYFLGYKLKDLHNFPILRIKRQYFDFLTDEKVDIKVDFVESLSHDLILVNLPILKQRYTQSKGIEEVLRLFEPAVNKFYLWVDEDKFSPEYKKILKRLNMATLKADILSQMQFEDEIMLAFKLMEKEHKEQISQLYQKIEQERQRAEQAVQRAEQADRRAEQERQRAEWERQRAEQERQRAEQERKRAEQADQRAEQERKRAEQLAKSYAKILKAQGVDIKEISRLTGLSTKEIEEL